MLSAVNQAAIIPLKLTCAASGITKDIMTYLWNQPGVPHKDWYCIEVIDLADDPSVEDEDDYETCQMCGKERIRFVHIMQHKDYPGPLRVGCVCAEKMSDDPVRPKEKEIELRNRASQRSRWLIRKWRESASGNFYLKIDGHHIGVARRQSGRWAYWLDKDSGPRLYNSKEEAQLALFDEFWNRHRRKKT